MPSLNTRTTLRSCGSLCKGMGAYLTEWSMHRCKPAKGRISAAAVGVLVLVMLLIQQIAAAKAPPADRFSFALVGDAPYDGVEAELFDQLVREVNADRDVSFVIHVGDIKGGEPCSDDVLSQRFHQIATFRAPVVYTPGDNEWTDCHRVGMGEFHPVERLEYLRTLFYSNPGQVLGDKPFAVESQSRFAGYMSYVENVTFEWARTRFATIHVVGSNNGLIPWEGIDLDDTTQRPRSDRIREFEARQAASLHWLDKVFALAERDGARAIVLAIHVVPEKPHCSAGPRDCALTGHRPQLQHLMPQRASHVLIRNASGVSLVGSPPVATQKDPATRRGSCAGCARQQPRAHSSHRLFGP